MDNFCQLFSLSPSWFKPSSYHSWRIPPASDFIFCGSARLILQNTVRFYRITLLSKSPAVTSQALEWNVEILTILCNTPHDLPASHRRSLVGCGPWGCYESDTTEHALLLLLLLTLSGAVRMRVRNFAGILREKSSHLGLNKG